MEKQAVEKGFTSIVFKTRNKFKAMLQLGLKNAYQIIGCEEKDDPSENRILLKKVLIPKLPRTEPEINLS